MQNIIFRMFEFVSEFEGGENLTKANLAAVYYKLYDRVEYCNDMAWKKREAMGGLDLTPTKKAKT